MTTEWATTNNAIVRSTDVRSRELDDDLVIYHPATDDITHLDQIARTVWEHLETQPTFKDLVSVLATRFETPRETISADIGPLLDDMQAARLITLSDS